MKRLMTGKKRFLLAGVAAASLAGGAYAFAASLSVTTNSLGSGSTVVANSCALSTGYTTTYDANSGSPRFDLATVKVSLTSCTAGTTVRADVGGSGGASLEEWTYTITSGDVTAGYFTLTAAKTVDAAAIVSVTAVVEDSTAFAQQA